MISPQEVLKKYWGYEDFRPNQLEIIEQVISGKDVLALLPTGGGKSLCYQVPALCMQGFTLVISPLIALMKDQVQHLTERGISAKAITSGMSRNEIDIVLDNAVHGHYKLLYVSPERLKTDIFRARLPKMNISFLAVDESHCISQWGYDFRPAYLEISALKDELKELPTLALTATATSDVVKDIQHQLKFKVPNVIKSSFERKNLSYNIIQTNSKEQEIFHTLKRFNAPSIVYCNTRRQTKSLAHHLSSLGIPALFYHGGMTMEDREHAQNLWSEEKVKVICATNAFGMGVDKGNVKVVLHFSPPSSIESYFQEIGRAGRNGEEAFGYSLFNEKDLLTLNESIEEKFPPRKDIIRIYKALGNHFQLAIGAGFMQTFSFNMKDFSFKYNLKPKQVYNGLKILELEGLISLNEAFNLPSRVMILANNKEIYQFKISNAKMAPLVEVLLRTYSGLFDDYVKIDEYLIANRLKVSRFEIINALNFLKNLNLIDYIETSDQPELTYLTERLSDNNLENPSSNIHFLKKKYTEQIESLLQFVQNDSTCRSVQLLHYFGEHHLEPCGKCDACFNNQLKNNPVSIQKIDDWIMKKIATPKTIEQLLAPIPAYKRGPIQSRLRVLIDEEIIKVVNQLLMA